MPHIGLLDDAFDRRRSEHRCRLIIDRAFLTVVLKRKAAGRSGVLYQHGVHWPLHRFFLFSRLGPRF